MTQNMFKNKAAFTLVEMLVVVSIISILGSTMIVTFNESQANARDARRMQDLQNMAAAMELFYSIVGRYPTETWCDSSIGSDGQSCADMIAAGNDIGAWNTSSSFYQQFVTNGEYFVGGLPVDPINNSSHYYSFEPSNTNEPNPGDAAGQGYYISVQLEDGNRWGVCGGTLTNYASWCH